MKIAIVNAQAPFVRGRAEQLAESLQLELEERGHRVDSLRIPFKPYPPQTVAEHILACRLLRLDAGDPDLAIALKFPAYLAPLPRKKVWLLHQHGQAYDFGGAPGEDVPATPEGVRVRDMVMRADSRYLPEAKEIFASSATVANRLRTSNNIIADGVLYPPLRRPEHFRGGPSGDYFFYPGRLAERKRQEVAIEAMRDVRSPFRLVLAGAPRTPGYGRHLAQLVARSGLEGRVELVGSVSEERELRLLAECYATLNLPRDEDYDFLTLQALHARKPVITFTDSGAARELLEDGRDSLIVEPAPRALAEAMERLWADRALTTAMGKHGFASLAQHRISWSSVIDRLLA